MSIFIVDFPIYGFGGLIPFCVISAFICEAVPCNATFLIFRAASTKMSEKYWKEQRMMKIFTSILSLIDIGLRNLYTCKHTQNLVLTLTDDMTLREEI